MPERRRAALVKEADWQRQVIDLARLLKWRVAHFRPAMTKHGWVTPVAADGKGFPDLILVRRSRIIAAELKSAKGELAADQIDWLSAFSKTGVEIHVWRPGDAEYVLRVLSRKDV